MALDKTQFVNHTIPAESINDPDAYAWVQWVTRRGNTKAYALNTATYTGEGVLRSLNGAEVPATAEIALPNTERDEFCLKIIAGKSTKPARKRRSKSRAGGTAANKHDDAQAAVEEEEVDGDSYLEAFADGTRYLVVYGGQPIGSFPAGRANLIDTDKTIDIARSPRTWAIRQNGKTVIRGNRIEGDDLESLIAASKAPLVEDSE